MKFGAVESKARLVMALFMLALLLTIGLSLGLYSQSRRELTNQRARQVRLELALLASQLSAWTSEALLERLEKNGIRASAAIYSADGGLIAQASTIERQPSLELLSPATLARPRADSATASVSESNSRTEGGFAIAELPAAGSAVFVMAAPVDSDSSPVIFYVFSYQIIALVFGLALIFLLARWLLRPYRRMVEAARGSPVHAMSAKSESEFVVETFQALVERLQTKERELAQLHELERRRAERSERFSERLITNIPSGLVTIDSRGLVTSANYHAREIFGPVEPDGKPVSTGALRNALRALAVDYRAFFSAAPKMIEMVGDCLSQGTPFRREEVEVIHTDGRVRHLGLSISPIVEGSHNIEGALCLMTDLTEVIELRERMKLQESLANLGEMAAGLAHEFKNSLATIYGYVQLLDPQAVAALASDDHQKTLEATLNEVKLLTRLVTDFLNFARPQQLNLGAVSLRSLLEDCAGELRAQLKSAGVELMLTGEFAHLSADESMLRRAFVNLLRNAAEAIDSQSPIKLIEVTGSIDAAPGRRHAHVRIRDTGGGISTEDLHRIFIPFFTTKSRGYGIGLAIVQKIIVAHGGSVSVERSNGAGTIFHCRLPLAASSGAVESK
jgi:signal transduction histidine kinase